MIITQARVNRVTSFLWGIAVGIPIGIWVSVMAVA